MPFAISAFRVGATSSATSMSPCFILRAETKPASARSALRTAAVAARIRSRRIRAARRAGARMAGSERSSGASMAARSMMPSRPASSMGYPHLVAGPAKGYWATETICADLSFYHTACIQMTSGNIPVLLLRRREIRLSTAAPAAVRMDFTGRRSTIKLWHSGSASL